MGSRICPSPHRRPSDSLVGHGTHPLPHRTFREYVHSKWSVNAASSFSWSLFVDRSTGLLVLRLGMSHGALQDLCGWMMKKVESRPALPQPPALPDPLHSRLLHVSLPTSAVRFPSLNLLPGVTTWFAPVKAGQDSNHLFVEDFGHIPFGHRLDSILSDLRIRRGLPAGGQGFLYIWLPLWSLLQYR